MVEETQEFAAELCTEYPPKAALQAPDSCGQLLTRILRPNVFFQVGGAVEGHDMAEPTLFGPLRQRGRLEAALRALVEAPALPWKPPLAGPPPLSPSKAWKAATHGLCGLCSDWDSLPLRTDAQAGSVDPMLVPRSRPPPTEPWRRPLTCAFHQFFHIIRRQLSLRSLSVSTGGPRQSMGSHP